MLTLKMNHHMVKLQTFHNYEVARITDKHLLHRNRKEERNTYQPEKFLATHWLSVTRERIDSHCNVLCGDIKTAVPSRNMEKNRRADRNGLTNSALGESHWISHILNA